MCMSPTKNFGNAYDVIKSLRLIMYIREDQILHIQSIRESLIENIQFYDEFYE